MCTINSLEVTAAIIIARAVPCKQRSRAYASLHTFIMLALVVCFSLLLGIIPGRGHTQTSPLSPPEGQLCSPTFGETKTCGPVQELEVVTERANRSQFG